MALSLQSCQLDILTSTLIAAQYASGNVVVWRWVILVGLLVPTYWVGEGIAQLIEAIIEWNFFENRRVLYYFIGTTVGCSATCYLCSTCRTNCHLQSHRLHLFVNITVCCLAIGAVGKASVLWAQTIRVNLSTLCATAVEVLRHCRHLPLHWLLACQGQVSNQCST